MQQHPFVSSSSCENRHPCYADDWTTDFRSGMPGFRSVMSRDRFLVILTFFHLCNNEMIPQGQPGHSRLFKIQKVTDMQLQRWQRALYPEKNVAVDESIIAFMGGVASLCTSHKSHTSGDCRSRPGSLSCACMCGAHSYDNLSFENLDEDS